MPVEMRVVSAVAIIQRGRELERQSCGGRVFQLSDE